MRGNANEHERDRLGCQRFNLRDMLKVRCIERIDAPHAMTEHGGRKLEIVDGRSGYARALDQPNDPRNEVCGNREQQKPGRLHLRVHRPNRLLRGSRLRDPPRIGHYRVELHEHLGRETALQLSPLRPFNKSAGCAMVGAS